MGNVKGINLCSSISLARETHAHEIDEVLSKLSPECRQAMETAIANRWYPIDIYSEWLEAEIKYICRGDVKVFKDRVYLGVERQFRGIYKAFLYLGQPEKVLKRVSIITNQYLQGVTVDLTIISKGKVEITYTGLTKKQAVMEIGIESWWERVLKLMGAKEIKVAKLASVVDGGGKTKFSMGWESR